MYPSDRPHGDYDYLLIEDGNATAGSFDAEETGLDRYGLLEMFNDVSNTDSATSPGSVDFYPMGVAFVDPGERSWWDKTMSFFTDIVKSSPALAARGVQAQDKSISTDIVQGSAKMVVSAGPAPAPKSGGGESIDLGVGEGFMDATKKWAVSRWQQFKGQFVPSEEDKKALEGKSASEVFVYELLKEPRGLYNMVAGLKESSGYIIRASEEMPGWEATSTTVTTALEMFVFGKLTGGKKAPVEEPRWVIPLEGPAPKGTSAVAPPVTPEPATPPTADPPLPGGSSAPTLSKTALAAKGPPAAAEAPVKPVEPKVTPGQSPNALAPAVTEAAPGAGTSAGAPTGSVPSQPPGSGGVPSQGGGSVKPPSGSGGSAPMGKPTPGQMEIQRMRQFLKEGYAELNDMIRARDALFAQGDLQLARIQDRLIQNVERNLASIEDILDLYIRLYGE